MLRTTKSCCERFNAITTVATLEASAFLFSTKSSCIMSFASFLLGSAGGNSEKGKAIDKGLDDIFRSTAVRKTFSA